MNSVRQLFDSVASTLSALLGKASGTVRGLLLLTIILVPGALLAQFAWKRWLAFRIGSRQRAIDAVAWRPGYRGQSESRRRLIQTSVEAKKSDEAIYEYSLYAAIVLLTGLAVVFYTAASRDAYLSSPSPFAGAVYIGLLGWAFNRLNALYKRRKPQRTDLPSLDAIDTVQPRTDPVRDAAGFSGEQSRIMGLTLAQLAVLLVVFVAACLTFTWVMSNTR